VKAKAAELISHTPLGKVIEWMSGDPEKCGYRHFRCCEERVHVTTYSRPFPFCGSIVTQ